MIGSQVAFCFWMSLPGPSRIYITLYHVPFQWAQVLQWNPGFCWSCEHFRLHLIAIVLETILTHKPSSTLSTSSPLIIILITAYDSVTAHQSNMFLKAELTKCYPLQFGAPMMWLRLIKGPCFNGPSCLWAFPTSPFSFPHFQNKLPRKKHIERLARVLLTEFLYTNQKTTRQHFKAPVWAKCNFPSSQFGLGRTGCTWVWCGSTSKLNCFPGNRKVRGRRMD